MNKQELIKKVEAWHIEKQTNDLKKQALYLLAEFGEFVGAYLKNDEAEMIDGLGDTMVVAINIARLADNPIELKNNSPFPQVEPAISLVLFELQDIVRRIVTWSGEIAPGVNVNTFVSDLASLATTLGYDLNDCLQSAYDVISKRTGKTVDGVFVKDE